MANSSYFIASICMIYSYAIVQKCYYDLQDVSHAQQGCIFLIKIQLNQEYFEILLQVEITCLLLLYILTCILFIWWQN